ELFFARQMILHAARSVDIDAIDCIYDNVSDLEGATIGDILIEVSQKLLEDAHTHKERTSIVSI
ncbi:MAG: hypothetical protein Q8853_02500, partial [Candidatus Phytoplasma australasiaticum]|nr:hypothetical protein [Candidatus Phytoplasma australasiaticum]